MRVAVGVASVFAGVLVYKLTRPRMPKNLQDKIDAKRRFRVQGRAELEKYVNDNVADVPSAAEQRRIAKLTALEIVEEIKSGKLRAVEVMVTACLRAKEAGEILNATADEMFMEAIAQAQEADAKLKRDGPEACGLLFGLPISIKDQIDVAGTDSTSGIPARCFDPAKKNALVVETLVKAGAIPFVKGNVPLSLMIIESTNDIFGRARNPWNPDFTPGGSSGGDAALVAFGAASLALGTDIGGSVRQPSAFCGLFSIKPTPERISMRGVSNPGKGKKGGQKIVLSTCGPMARSAKDVAKVMEIWLSEESSFWEDAFWPPLPLKSLRNPPPKMRVGVFTNDGWFDTSPSGARAVREVEAILHKLGHEVVPFHVPRPFEFVRLYLCLLSAEGKFRNMKSGLDGAPFLEEYKRMEKMMTIPNFLRPYLASILRFIGEDRKAFLVAAGGEKTTFEYQELIRDAHTYRQEFADVMKNLTLDALICPAGNFAGLKHGKCPDLLPGVSMTYLFNVLHFPAGTVPVTQVRQDECELLESEHNDSWTSTFRESLEGTTNLPIAVQVVAKPYQDETVLELMMQLEENLTPLNHPIH